MTKINWWLVDVLSRLLKPDERDAVRGDFEETGEPGGRALRDVLGLVVRRQAALWKDWGPWVAVAGVVVPLGMLLTVVSQWWADTSARDAWFYVHIGHWSFLTFPGWRNEVIRIGVFTSLSYLALIGWSWTTGFALGSLSRRTLWVTATLFCLVVLAGSLGVTSTAARSYNAAVFVERFYGVVFPRLVRVTLVLVPALWGMHWSRRSPSPPLLRTILGAAAIAILTAWTSKSIEYSVIFGWHLMAPRPGIDGIVGTGDDPHRLFPLVLMCPVVYIVARAIWERRYGKNSCTPGSLEDCI